MIPKKRNLVIQRYNDSVEENLSLTAKICQVLETVWL